MPPRPKGHGNLARRLLASTLASVALASVAVGLAALWGVYELNVREDFSLLDVQRELMTHEVTDHLTRIREDLVAVQGVEDLPPHGAGSVQSVALRALPATAEIDAFVAIDDDGCIAAASPASAPSSLASVKIDYGDEPDSLLRFVSDAPGSGQGRPVVWAISRMHRGQGKDLVLAGRLRESFFDELFEHLSEQTPYRTAFVVDSAGHLIAAQEGGVPIEMSAVRFGPATGGDENGRASGVSRDYGQMDGFFEDIEDTPGLQWRIVVMQSNKQALRRAASGIWPALLAMGLVAAAATSGAFFVGRRIVAPIAELERTAHEAATGAHPEPVLVGRSDEVGRLAEAFNQITVHLSSLQDIAQLLATASDATEVYDAVLAAITRLLATSDAALFLSDPDSAGIDLVRGHGLCEPDARMSIAINEPSPITAAYRKHVEVLFEDRGEPTTRSILQLFGAEPGRSGIAFPLIFGQETLGVVIALASPRREVSDAQIETLRAFCAQAAVAVRTSRLFGHEQLSRQEAEALRDAAEAIVGTHDLDDALRRVGVIATGMLDASQCSIALENRTEFGLKRVPEADVAEQEAILELWRSEAADRLDLTSPFDPAVVRDPYSGAGMLLVPLVRSRHVRGVMALKMRHGAEAPDARHVALARALGKQVSLALENASLLEEARTRAANLETVFRISQAVSSSLQVEVVLNRVLDVVQKIFSADAVSLMAYDRMKRSVVTSIARGIARHEMQCLSVAPGEDIPGQVFKERKPARCGDLASLDTRLARLATAQGLHSMLAVPLLARGRSIGVLTMYDRNEYTFTREDQDLLLTFATQAALAIDTAALYSREHHVASVLQGSILPPRLPVMPGIESSSFYLAAEVDAEIGGDYYDVFATGDGTVVVAIGDVCGKGVQAATKTSMTKYSLRGMVAAGAGPAEALRELNRFILNSGNVDIVTVWVGFLDPSRRRLRYANAGHPPALLKRGGTTGFDRLDATGPLLGALDNAVYVEKTIDLAPDDLLLMYTDGVTETRRGKHFFGEGRIRRVMRSSRTAEEVIDSLLEAVATFSSGVMRDDAAALAIRIGAHDGTARNTSELGA